MPPSATPADPPTSVTPGQALVTAIGCVLIGIGVAAVLAADMGADPYTLFVDGISTVFELPIGLALVIAGSIMSALAWLLGHRPTSGLLMTVGLVGLVVGAASTWMPSPTADTSRLVQLAAGLGLIGIGVGTYRAMRWAEGPLDALPQALADRLGHPSAMFALVQAALLGLGWGLGGQVGAGTVLAVLALGPTTLRSERLVGNLLGGEAHAVVKP
ncbi:MAG: hypothetical protein RIB65_17125 [Ilumatobacter fluminis]|uniref:hypothetical protein n=1 Tax=Ilumatobacter fluminis TaxID=467091 RepID=UPI0032ED41A2